MHAPKPLFCDGSSMQLLSACVVQTGRECNDNFQEHVVSDARGPHTAKKLLNTKSLDNSAFSYFF
jgi:hypothetical protein